MDRRQFITFLLFTVMVVILCLQGLTLYRYTQDSDIDRDLLASMGAVITQSQQLSTSLIDCDSHCDIQIPLAELEEGVRQVQRDIANEKQYVSSVGTNHFQRLQLAIERYNVNQDPQQLHRSLSDKQIDLLITVDNTAEGYQIKLGEIKRTFFIQSATYVTTLLVLALVTYVYLNSVSHQQKTAFHRLTLSVAEMADDLAHADLQQAALKKTSSVHNKHERAIYSSFFRLHERLENAQENEDIYRQLYGFIGYEIRGLSTTINGGVKLILQETDENSVVLAKDITSATDALSDLADNYNKLISHGSEDNKQVVELQKLFTGLAVNLSSRASENTRLFDCYLPANMPEYMTGNYTKLFWALLLCFSNALQSSEIKHVLLLCRLDHSDNIETIKLSFELIFLTENETNYLDATQANWQPHTQRQSTNNAALQLIDKRYDPTMQWHASTVGEKLTITVETTPKRYLQLPETLKESHILVCGDNNLQTSIITQVMHDLGAETETVRTPNDIFRKLKEAQDYDAIVISDTLNGIKLKSFCKTLKSRLAKTGNTKLILSISDPQPFEEGYEMVDKMIQHPFTSIEFAQKVEQLLTEAKDENILENKPILIVEDDKVQQFILKTMLSKQGYEAVCAGDGLAAVKMVQETEFDIVFMDCIMPGLDGFEATKRIRQLEKDHRVKNLTIIGATALSSNSEHKACVDAGMDYVINKPYNAEQIFKVIKKYAALQKIS
uniref:ATP-binding response regulator n=1 Tax=Thaumasiovibrio occultus TaxID=1891184 RepID=UPI000B362858|nr:response regulator [Thaumasiovibrio occultus]